MNTLEEREYIDVTPQRFAITLVNRLKSDIEIAMNSDKSRWWLVIADLDTALTCQLVAYLSGSMQLGALKKEPQLAMLKYFNNSQQPNNKWPTDKNGNRLREEIAPLCDLLSRAMDANFQFVNNAEHPLNLSDEEVADIKRLHQFRNDLAHIKPTLWALETTGLPRMATATIKAIEHLFANCPARIHLESNQIENMEGQLRVLREQLV